MISFIIGFFTTIFILLIFVLGFIAGNWATKEIINENYILVPKGKE